MSKFCPECGNSLVNETSKFCDKCGAKVGETNPTKYNQETINSQKNYSTSYILILVFILSLVAFFINIYVGIIMVMISAAAVYSDAKSIGAGTRFEKESMNTLSWTPFSWGLIVLLLWIIGFPLYLIKRNEIFNQLL